MIRLASLVQTSSMPSPLHTSVRTLSATLGWPFSCLIALCSNPADLLRKSIFAGASAATDELRRVIAAAFLMRRKKLANNLKAAFALDHEAAVACLKDAEIDPDVRGEALDIQALARLSDVLGRRKEATT